MDWSKNLKTKTTKFKEIPESSLLAKNIERNTDSKVKPIGVFFEKALQS